MGELLTVKEFAERAGVSTQAVYARLASKEIANFVQVEQGKKSIDSAALAFFSDKHNGQVDCKGKDNLQSEILTKMLDTLREQLTEKDKQLQAAAEEKAELLARLKDAQQAEQQAHALHAGTMQTALIESRPEAAQTVEKRTERRGWKFWRK